MQANESQLDATRKELASYLRKDYDHLKYTHQNDEKIARHLLMKKIRCVLVKHPLDHVGRKIAKETKIVFLHHVLGQTNIFQRMTKRIGIPQCVKNKKHIKDLCIYIPLTIAFMNMTFQLVVYNLDFFSDAKVIFELNFPTTNFHVCSLGFQDSHHKPGFFTMSVRPKVEHFY